MGVVGVARLGATLSNGALPIDDQVARAGWLSGTHPCAVRVGTDVRAPGWREHCRVKRTLLIVDDHAGFRSSAKALLEAGGYEVVGEAGDGESALAEARRLIPDVVLLDVVLPDIDGFAVCDELAVGGNGPVIVMTSSHDISAYRQRLERSPARGFIGKSELSGPNLAELTG